MQQIDIDFEVFKELTIRRETEEMTCNDVIRKLLNMEQSNIQNNNEPDESHESFVSKSIIFPHGTQFRAHYKGKLYYAEVEDGAIVYNGQRHTSPSSAGRAVTGTNVNGWIFWECKRPGEDNWIAIDDIKNTGSHYAVE